MPGLGWMTHVAALRAPRFRDCTQTDELCVENKECPGQRQSSPQGQGRVEPPHSGTGRFAVCSDTTSPNPITVFSLAQLAGLLRDVVTCFPLPSTPQGQPPNPTSAFSSHHPQGWLTKVTVISVSFPENICSVLIFADCSAAIFVAEHTVLKLSAPVFLQASLRTSILPSKTMCL